MGSYYIRHASPEKNAPRRITWRGCAAISFVQSAKLRPALCIMRIAAAAETTYADPSALLRLYVHQPGSTAMSAWRARAKGALAATHHGRVEIVNGICLAAFRKLITMEALSDAMASFEEDFEEGFYIQADLLWRAALRRASDLSRKHTPALGCR